MNVGLYFGSFNPVHAGHMVIANYMLAYAGLDKLWFVVSPHNPLKDKSTLLDDRHRLELVRLAIGDNNKMKASDIEFKMKQPSYTIHTLTYLKEKYPTYNFHLIMGSDNLATLHKWKNYEEILKQFHILVYPRPKSDGGPLQAHPNVKMVSAPHVEISSTFIREAIKAKKDVRYYVPPAAWEYIREMHFYEK